MQITPIIVEALNCGGTLALKERVCLVTPSIRSEPKVTNNYRATKLVNS